MHTEFVLSHLQISNTFSHEASSVAPDIVAHVTEDFKTHLLLFQVQSALLLSFMH